MKNQGKIYFKNGIRSCSLETVCSSLATSKISYDNRPIFLVYKIQRKASHALITFIFLSLSFFIPPPHFPFAIGHQCSHFDTLKRKGTLMPAHHIDLSLPLSEGTRGFICKDHGDGLLLWKEALSGHWNLMIPPQSPIFPWCIILRCRNKGFFSGLATCESMSMARG